MEVMYSRMTDQGNGVFTKRAMSRLQVKAPYDERFVRAAHQLEGRWRKRSGIWSFQRHQYTKVALALNTIFGTKLVVREVEQDD